MLCALSSDNLSGRQLLVISILHARRPDELTSVPRELTIHAREKVRVILVNYSRPLLSSTTPLIVPACPSPLYDHCLLLTALSSFFSFPSAVRTPCSVVYNDPANLMNFFYANKSARTMIIMIYGAIVGRARARADTRGLAPRG